MMKRWARLEEYLRKHPYIQFNLSCYRASGGERMWAVVLFKEGGREVVARESGSDAGIALAQMLDAVEQKLTT